MKLLTKEIMDRIPPLGAMEEQPLDEHIVHVKYFKPDSNWTWWAFEASAITTEGKYLPLSEIGPVQAWMGKPPRLPEGIEDIQFFGMVNGFELELGYFSLNELMSVRWPPHLPIERDLYFGTPTWGEVQATRRR